VPKHDGLGLPCGKLSQGGSKLAIVLMVRFHRESNATDHLVDLTDAL
jgi:hypothetical protein